MKFLFDFFPAAAFLIAMFIPENREEGIYLATKVIIVTSFLQIIVSWFFTRRIEKQYVLIFLVVLILGSMTLFLHDERFIKWKPTIVFWIFSLICLGSEFIGKENIPKKIMGHMFDAPSAVWLKVNISLILFFVVLGLINIYVAYNYATETWAFFKVFGVMGINFVFILGLVMYLSRYMIEVEEKEKS
ncbi:MAG: septation protein A [Gammaproteobacteria bacterium]|nr:septation protein A [Gammaproteobacteria bacterium]